MATVISIINPKGGSGKSTLSTNLARALQLSSAKVLLIDGDGQGSASEWSDRQAEDSDYPLVAGVGMPQQLRNHVPRVAPDYDFILIDGSANALNMDASAIRVSDIVLIPVKPTAPDIWGVNDLVDTIHARREIADGKPHTRFVVSQQQTGTILARDIEQALSGYEIPVFNSRTSVRVAFAEAMTGGMSVLDYEPNGQAANEIRAITDELLALLNSST